MSTPTGLLLVNLGTPDSPKPADVRRYLREFLSDPRVIDVNPVLRFIFLNFIILPFRPKKSGEAYEKVWTERGSPLLFHGLDLTEKVRARLNGVPVELGMRYGKPSIADALRRLIDRGADRIVVFPMFPQYSSAATGSALEVVYHEAGKLWNTPTLDVVPPFFDHAAYIDACARVASRTIEGSGAEVVLFSFHGLPERQCIKSDPTGNHCFKSESCCDALVDANRWCYRAQCLATARALADRLGLPAEKRIVCFQSRLGRTPWIRPYTDEIIIDLAKRGVKRAAILSPAFVADCLETLEELGIRAAASFREHGGEELRVVPAVNAEDFWADGVVAIAREAAGRGL
ncbi:MAG TPA: ferrochelatase [Candidatus Polarisedimenticolaceae bacterium]|nr:ferrochelatase [Candidatus Polarisedimenticolaceae bacterium]